MGGSKLEGITKAGGMYSRGTAMEIVYEKSLSRGLEPVRMILFLIINQLCLKNAYNINLRIKRMVLQNIVFF